MSMFGSGSELGPVPSYYLAEITVVNAEDHTCSVVLLRGFETYDNVILMRDPGNFSLPTVGDLCTVFWDNKNKPVINGVYPTFYQENKDLYKFYFVQEGERMLQSEFGQKLLMNKRGLISLTNRLSQGVEIDEQTGIVTFLSDSIIHDASGVDKRIGQTKRYSPLTKKEATITSSTGMDATTGAGQSTVGTTLIEDNTIIEEEGITGEKIYEHTVGNMVVEENKLSEIKTVPMLGSNPLRSKTTYYSKGSAGTIKLDVLIDVLGNVDIQIPTTALESGVNIEGIVNDIVMKFANITIDGTSIKVGETAASVELGLNPAKQLCNNFTNCLFTGAPHAVGNTTVKV